MKIKSIDENSIVKRIKKLEDKEIIEYFNALQRSCESWKDTAHKAINKLKDGTKGN